MSRRKSERIVNLTILLLSSRRFLTKEQIRESVEGYQGLGEQAFERMFERDKDDLRAMGVPIVTGSNDTFFADEEGYRISPADYQLPEVSFTPAETAVLGLAAQVWQQASTAEESISALTKLRAAGLDPDDQRLAALQPTMNAPEPSFEAIKAALTNRQVITFSYRGSPATRTLEPWQLAFRHGAWYVVGHDRDRAERRTFKLSRITSPPRAVGKPGAFQPQPLEGRVMGFDEVSATTHQAVVAIRGGHAPALRRRGRPIASNRTLPEGFEAWQVPYVRRHTLLAELAEQAPHVAVIEPEDVARAHLEHLRRVVAAHPQVRPGNLAGGQQ